MRHQRVSVGPKNRLIGWKFPWYRMIVEESVRPGNEVLPVRGIGVPLVMLTPCQSAVEKPRIHWRHLRVVIVAVHSQIFRTQKAVDTVCCHRRHEAALVV